MKASRLNLTGPECVKVGMNCLAPKEDAAYFMSKRLWLPDDRVYAVVGALGTQTGNATYVGLGLNSSVTQLGFDNIDDDSLAGTANGYDVPNHDRFFLQYFARDCTGLEALTDGSHCYSIGDQLPDCTDPARSDVRDARPFGAQLSSPGLAAGTGAGAHAESPRHPAAEAAGNRIRRHQHETARTALDHDARQGRVPNRHARIHGRHAEPGDARQGL